MRQPFLFERGEDIVATVLILLLIQSTNGLLPIRNLARMALTDADSQHIVVFGVLGHNGVDTDRSAP